MVIFIFHKQSALKATGCGSIVKFNVLKLYESSIFITCPSAVLLEFCVVNTSATARDSLNTIVE